MLTFAFSGWRIAGTLLIMLGVALCCGLGVWQIGRLNERLALNAHIDAQMVAAPIALPGAIADPQLYDYRHVLLHGTFDPSQEIVLRNRSYNDVTGMDILTPLRLTGQNVAVLVNRGWIPLTDSAPAARRAFAPPSGPVTVDGVARISQQPTGSLVGGPQDPPPGPSRPRVDAWFWVTIPRIQQQISYPLLPVYVEEQPGPGAQGLPARSPTSDFGPGPHMSYAIQWFSFALIMLVGYLALIHQRYTAARESGSASAEQRRPSAVH